MLMVKNQKGFSILIILIFLGLFTGIGIIAYKKIVNNASEYPSTSSQEETYEQSKAASKTKIYTNDEYGFSFLYPNDWDINIRVEAAYEPGKQYYDIELETPNGNSMYVKADLGGRGGDCQPNDGDKPHQENNACPTWEVLNKERVTDTVRVLKERTSSGDKFFDVPLYVTDIKFTDENGTAYGVCLNFADLRYYDSAEEALPLGSPKMGLYSKGLLSPISVYPNSVKDSWYLYTCIFSDDETFLSSEDAKHARDIYRSINIKDSL